MAKKDFIDLRVRGLLKQVDVTVATGQTVGSSAADSALQGGMMIGFYPYTNQDQGIGSIALNADGSVTVTLRAAATANNYFMVAVVR